MPQNATPDPPDGRGSPASDEFTLDLDAGSRRACCPLSWTNLRAWLREHTFLPTWLPQPWARPAVAYAAAFLIQLAAVGTTYIIVRRFPKYAFLGTLFDLSAVFIASTFGAGPGLLAAFLGTFALAFLVLPPHFAFTGTKDVDIVGVFLSLLVAILIVHMVSQRERARQLAQAAVHRMDEFLGIAGHEFRTPLTALKLTVAVAQRRLREVMALDIAADPDNVQRQLEQIAALLARADDQMRRQSRLVTDLVDASRLEVNRFDMWLQHTDLAALVRRVVEEQREAHPDRTITLDLPEGLPVPIKADPDRIAQLLTGYLDNALKYSEASRPVEVTLQREDATARVSVCDHGPGLSEDEQSSVWDIFHRAPGVEVQTGSSVGLGLGLYLCRAIAERHGGRVGVQSAPGAGATFWFTLPVAPPDW